MAETLADGNVYLDLTLDNFMVPDLPEITPEFGTKVETNAVNKGGLSTLEVNSNVMMFFNKQRPVVITASAETSTVEYNANLVIEDGDLTLGNGGFLGCVVKVTLLKETRIYYTAIDGSSVVDTVLGERTLEYTWNGTGWFCSSAPVIDSDHKQKPLEETPSKIFGGQWEINNSFAGLYEVYEDVKMGSQLTEPSTPPFLAKPIKCSETNVSTEIEVDLDSMSYSLRDFFYTLNAPTLPSSPDTTKTYSATNTLATPYLAIDISNGEKKQVATIKVNKIYESDGFIGMWQNHYNLVLESAFSNPNPEICLGISEAAPNSTGYIGKDDEGGYGGAFGYYSEASGPGGTGAGYNASFNLENGRKYWMQNSVGKTAKRTIYGASEHIRVDSIPVVYWKRIL